MRNFLHPALLFAILALPPIAFGAFVDSDTNGLDDTWEMTYFGALGNDPDDDPDGDGHSNLEECTASTDPNDPDSCFVQVGSSFDPASGKISWASRLGKIYRLEFSSDLNDWSDVFGEDDGMGTITPVDFHGNGGTLTLDLSDPTTPDLRGGATREVWLNAGGSGNVNNFKTGILNWPNANSPASPAAADPSSGVELTNGLQAPTNYGDQYGQRLRGFIVAPEKGDYTFYIAGRHECEFWMSGLPGSTSINDLSLVLRQTNQQIVTSEDWDYYATHGITPDDQKSAPINLDAGERYYFEVLHRHNGQEDHLAVGWTKPSDAASEIEVIPGEHISPVVDLTSTNGTVIAGDRRFARVKTFGPSSPVSLDTDGDGIDDGTENILTSFNPFDANSTGQDGGGDDGTALTNALAATAETISVEIANENAREDNGVLSDGSPRIRNVSRFRINRAGGLKPLTIFFTMGGGDDLVDGLPQEENSAEASDYVTEDIHQQPIAGSIQLAGGAFSTEVVINPVLDSIHEYPETVSLSIDPHASYDIDAGNQRRENIIYDQRDEADNEILFVGFSLPQPGSQDPQGSAICSGKLNATKDTLTLFTTITAGFSAPQNNSHIHKDIGTPGTDPVAFSLPQTGEIADLEWPLHDNGIYTPQKMIDSLFNQVNETTTTGESKVYINWHTNENPNGELYAFLEPATGSVEPPIPNDPPAIAHIDPITQATELRREITRFLTQSTFGATQALVDDLHQRVLIEPGNDRIAAFGKWIDEQLDQLLTPQTSVLENTFASDWQEWVLRGYYDPNFWEASDWGSNGPPDPLPTPPPLPSSWPGLDPYNPDLLDYADPDSLPEPTGNFPLANGFINTYYRNADLGLGRARRDNTRRALWTIMLDGKDQLRQRLAFAWSQILVVSWQDQTTRNYYYGLSRYWDMLAENADDTFREMLEGVTYSPMMGNYLSHLKNQMEADLDDDGEPDVFPDENYAREIMQLFSIGLFVLHTDGSLALDPVTGLPQPTYLNTDITELSRIMTGLSFSKAAGQNTWDDPANNSNFSRANGNQWYGATFEYPMKMFGQFHDPGVKTIVGGVTVDNTGLIGNPNNPSDADLTAVGHADLADVHDWLAGSGAAPYDGHPSTPAFLAFRLIQRLVDSNPPRDYVYRVAKTFEDTGGNLREVTKAILLDYYARSPEIIDDTYGRKKPPLMGYMQMSRALGGDTQLLLSELGNGAGDSTDYKLSATQRANYTTGTRFRYGDTNNQLAMAPLGAETVFNFYLPAYSPGGPISTASLVAPEFQILNETTAIQNVNYFYALGWNGSTINTGQGLNALPNQTYWGYAGNADHNTLDRDAWIAVWNDSDAAGGSEWENDKALIDALDEILNAGRLQQLYTLDPADRTPAQGDRVVVDPDQNPYEILIDILTESYGTSANNIRDKVRLAFYLMTTTATYQVQK